MREKQGIYLGWKFPGGLVDPGESLYEAAAREVKAKKKGNELVYLNSRLKKKRESMLKE